MGFGAVRVPMIVAGLVIGWPVTLRTLTVADQQSAKTKDLRVARVTPHGGGLASAGALGSFVDISIDTLQNATAVDPTKLVLYLDGYAVTGVTGILIDPTSGTVRFALRRTADNKEVWRTLYRLHGIGTDSVRVSAGLPDEGEIAQQVPTRPNRMALTVVPAPRLVFAIVFVLVVVIALVYLAGSTALLREAPRPGAGTETVYSLGRVQMAFWFALIVAAFLFIWIATVDYNDVLTDQSLILMGIGTGTALASAAVSGEKRSQATQRLARLVPQEREIQRAQSEAQADVSGALTVAALAVRDSIETNERQLGKQHSTFWEDILNDQNGPAFHRFQLVVWTVVLGCVFMFEVIDSLTMPQFNGTLLALMGISGTTYIGFKFPEVPK